MAITNKTLSARAKKRREYLDNLPPTKFPVVINLHVFDMSTVEGDKTCLQCGQLRNHKLHIHPHYFNRNFSSKLTRCMCGLNLSHPIHIGEN